METTLKTNISFREFTVDPKRRRLFKNGENISLNPKTFDLLLALIERRGKVVSKEELLNAIWGEQFIEEGNLTVNISLLRKTLGDRRGENRYIITVPGIGYRFVAEIEEETDEITIEHHSAESIIFDEEIESENDATNRSQQVQRPKTILPSVRSKSFIPYILAAIFLTAAVSYYLWQGSESEQNVLLSRQSLVTNFTGSHSSASFSPDGKRIAFVNRFDDASQIWIKDLNGADPFRISPESEFAERPRWSPVADEIIYVRRDQEKPTIWKISPNGGQPVKIIDDGRNPNWSWDGKLIVFERGYDIWLSNSVGGEQFRLEGVPPTDLLLADRFPAFSPDNSLIAFFQNDKGPIGDYWVVPSVGGDARRLTFDNIFGGAPVWMPGSNYIIFPSQRAGSMTLWRVSSEGGIPPEPVLTSPGEDTEPEISRDGRKLVYTNTRSNYAVTVSNPATGEARTLRESRGVLVDATFSPDGRKVSFFGINEKGDIQIFSIGADGNNLVQVTQKSDERNHIPQWSADGETIYFYQIHPVLSFRKIPASGGESTELVHGWQWGEQNGARVSPDESLIVYSKLDKGSVFTTKIRKISDGTEKTFISALRHPKWSHDQKFIAGTDLPAMRWDLAEIVVCSVEEEKCRRLTRGFNACWSADDSQIYFYKVSDLKNGAELWRISADGQNEEKVMDLQPMDPIGDFYDVSPQGEILWVKYERGKNELWMADYPSE